MGGSGGGGGGGYFSGTSNPEELRRQVRAAEEQARDEQFETQVATLLDSYLADINRRDSEAIGRHTDEILNALGSEIEGSVALRFGGSVAKHTYVDGLSDVDALVILSKSELAKKSPGAVRSYFVNRLRERFPNTPVTEGKLAVTVSFTDAEIQLLPALKAGTGVRIPAADGSGWSPTVQPEMFAKKITQLNKSLNGKLVPTIKLAKSILSELPEQHRLAGYHVESLAIETFKSYTGTHRTKDMLKYFFTHASDHLKYPIKDSTGQSIHVDDYLGPSGSLKRRIIADAVGRTGRSMQNADGANSLDQWREILGETP